jgi:integrating conjugative element protein (TIGR03746 family)
MPLNTRYRGMIDVQSAHIATLRVAIVVLLGLCGFLWWGWASAPNQITVHVPPDLRTGASSHVHDIPPESVYLFAEYIFQQLQRWESDGSKDFAANIYRLQHYLTPEYQNLLLADYRQRFGSGQLNKVARGMQPLADSTFTPDKVQIVVQHSTWVVFLDAKILEWVAGMKTKDTDIRFPLRVVRLDVDREKNPWGLALAGYPNGIGPESLADIRKREVSQR